MIAALRRHWPEYLMEAALLGAFMVAACLATVALEHPGSALHVAIPSALARRALIGLAMGLTAVALIHSPWGKRSGAHMNPAVTIAFWRLGKIEGPDALFYVLAQTAGGLLGVTAIGALLGPRLADPAVNYAVTRPGAAGVGVAWVAEFAIAAGMMLTVLYTSNHPRFAMWTGLFAGALVALYITFEAPLSGMSMNPARSLASALPARLWTAFWIYMTAPVLAMLGAAELYARSRGLGAVYCAKLHHFNRQRCIFRCRFDELRERAGMGSNHDPSPSAAGASNTESTTCRP